MNFRRFTPKTLFARGLLIVVVPIVLVEAVSAYIFYQRHWDNVTRHMTSTLAGEIAFLAYEEQNLSRQEREEVEWVFSWTTGINAHFMSGEEIMETDMPSAFPDLEEMLQRRVALPLTVQRSGRDMIAVQIQLPDGVLALTTTTKRLESTTTTIFLLWMFGSTVVFLSIALLFLRNQVRPIRQLAEAAERFGKGSTVVDVKPHGAQEVRRAARAFLVMRERILRQMRSRTDMLAGISHDLRTPLTRMKLQLALLEHVPESKELAQDIAQMEHMIAAYLNFAKGDSDEESEAVSLEAALSALAADYRRANQQITYALPQDITLNLRPQAFRRMLTNIVDNALRYGKECAISARLSAGKIELFIDDAGPGIPPEKREEVFLPFQRLDASRNLNSGGAGLGLSIARDIARSHGGNIALSESPAGGLRVIIRLPR